MQEQLKYLLYVPIYFWWFTCSPRPSPRPHSSRGVQCSSENWTKFAFPMCGCCKNQYLRMCCNLSFTSAPGSGTTHLLAHVQHVLRVGGFFGGALSAFMVVGGGKLFCRSRRLPASHWKLVFSPGLACDHVRYLTSSGWVDGVGDGHLLILCVCSSSVPVTYCQSTRSVYMNYFHHVLGTQISLHWNVAGVGKGRSRRRRRT